MRFAVSSKIWPDLRALLPGHWPECPVGSCGLVGRLLLARRSGNSDNSRKTLFVFVVKTHRTILQTSNRMMASVGTDGEWARLLCVSGV